MAADWKPLLAGITSQHLDLAAGKRLFKAGAEARSLFHVEQGSITLSRHGVVLHRVEAGALVAETSLFAPRYDCDAVAESDCHLEEFPKAAVLLHLSAHPQIALAFTAFLARQARLARGLLEVIRLKGARERTMAYLTVKGAADAVITLDRPLMEVASRIGLTHEAFYRTLKVLETEGRLARPGKRSFRLITQDGQ
ncbi:protein kinase [Paramagnetospirillum marisnigri]|uniref:Protein kinase n=1 Tax=Paramagnetospirillum marisnigri TaxID=1285242 RepID=A0A178MQG5_9PROT|nr:Crp/Fnr family transcriptional regulator [Paramagnetospirillum marisnigri]OAN50348.1 protein kinase [Paramagnetospirillum marisnigri]